MRISDWSSDVCSSDLSKIALGSGGFSGKGFLQGTQSHLSFLPEKQTDFIFTMLAEEHGLIGGLVLLTLYLLLIAYGYAIALRARSQYGRLVRSDEQTSELQSIMRISSAVFCLQKT